MFQNKTRVPLCSIPGQVSESVAKERAFTSAAECRNVNKIWMFILDDCEILSSESHINLKKSPDKSTEIFKVGTNKTFTYILVSNSNITLGLTIATDGRLYKIIVSNDFE